MSLNNEYLTTYDPKWTTKICVEYKLDVYMYANTRELSLHLCNCKLKNSNPTLRKTYKKSFWTPNYTVSFEKA